MGARSKRLLVVLLVVCTAGCTGRSGVPVVGEFVDIINTPGPRQTVRDAFNVYDADMRRAAIDRLSAAPFGGDGPYLETYRLIVTDQDPTVVAACLRALGRHGGPEDAAVIARRLQHESSLVRWTAAGALQKVHNPEAAVGPLVRVLSGNEPEADVRAAAARALGQYALPLVFDTLVGALNDRDYSVAEAAHRSLVTLTGREELPVDSRDWIAWAKEHRGRLFAGGTAYTYEPYPTPPSFFDDLQFWKEAVTPEPRRPRGIGVDGGAL